MACQLDFPRPPLPRHSVTAAPQTPRFILRGSAPRTPEDASTAILIANPKDPYSKKSNTAGSKIDDVGGQSGLFCRGSPAQEMGCDAPTSLEGFTRWKDACWPTKIDDCRPDHAFLICLENCGGHDHKMHIKDIKDPSPRPGRVDSRAPDQRYGGPRNLRSGGALPKTGGSLYVGRRCTGP